MNQHNWMRYECYERVRDGNKLKMVGQNVSGKTNNCSFSLALLLWWVMKCGAD